MTTKQSTKTQEDAKKNLETAVKEQDGRRVRQGEENAKPTPDEVLAKPAGKDASQPPYTTAREDQGDSTVVRGADGDDLEVNVEAANTTRQFHERMADENPATKALREQEMRRVASGTVVNSDVAAAVEQARQNEVAPAVDPESADEQRERDARQAEKARK